MNFLLKFLFFQIFDPVSVLLQDRNDNNRRIRSKIRNLNFGRLKSQKNNDDFDQ